MPYSKLVLPKGIKVPDHIAIIPDGNRRWARSKGFPTFEGHRKGFNRAVEVSRSARDIGVHTVTLWGFSTENWDRTPAEVTYLMKLYQKLINDYLKEAKRDKVRIVHLGRKDRIPKALLNKITFAEEETKKNNKYIMNIAIDYGGHDDIIRAVKGMIKDGVKQENVDKNLFEKYLDTRNQPYPYVDLMIRTSGEQRTSGYLLWQSVYAETYWENDHFPDFSPEKLKEAVLDYSRRRRRFGGNDNLEHLTFDPKVVANLEVSWWRLRKISKGERFRDYATQHFIKQFGLSTRLATQATKYFLGAFLQQDNGKNWNRAIIDLKKFYKLIKEELKLAFEPSVVATLQVKFWEDVSEKEGIEEVGDAEETAKKLYAEVYRISLFQAAKAAHLMVLANIERNLAEKGFGEKHWVRAEDYLQRFYSALKERVA